MNSYLVVALFDIDDVPVRLFRDLPDAKTYASNLWQQCQTAMATDTAWMAIWMQTFDEDGICTKSECLYPKGDE